MFNSLSVSARVMLEVNSNNNKAAYFMMCSFVELRRLILTGRFKKGLQI